MRINSNKAYIPQAGDILSWTSGEEKILFVVLENEVMSNKMVGVTLIDNRPNLNENHIVYFHEDKFNYRLHLVCKRWKAEFDLDLILDEWRIANE